MNPFLGEVRLFPWDFAPKGWALCNGALLSIQQNTALFSLLGTQYGGNGIQTFGLPDLRGRTPVHFGTTYTQGEMTGVETVTLLLNQMPTHNHLLQGTSSTTGNVNPAAGHALANVGVSTDPHYGPDSSTIAINPGSIQGAGGSQPHANMQPYLVLNYCIALQGIFPSRN